MGAIASQRPYAHEVVELKLVSRSVTTYTAHMRLTRLNVSVHPRLRMVDIELSAEKTVLLGQNGTGKTTLLELVSCILTSDFTEYVRAPLRIEYELEFADAHLKVALSNMRPHREDRSRNESLGTRESRNLSEVNVVEEYARRHFDWNYSVELTLNSGPQFYAVYGPGGGKIHVRDSAAAGHSLAPSVRDCEPVNPFEECPFLVPVLFEMHRELGDEIRRRILLCAIELLEVSRSCYRFDEALGAFDVMIGSRRRGGASLVVRRVKDKDGDTARFYPSDAYAMPRELIRAAMEQAPGWPENKTEHLPHFAMASRDLPFLRTACDLMGFADGSIEGQIVAREGEGEDVYWRIRGWRFEFSEGHRAFLHDALSFGQKRILAFLYYVAANDQVVIADELVNGLHHQWIESALAHLQGRQAFLSSQNPLLLDHLDFDSVEQVKRCFIVCSKEGEAPRMHARNLTTQEASLFKRKLGAGVQQVSEILEDMGLW